MAALDLPWFESRPLFGRRVVVTRARHQASGLVERLRAAGAEAVEVPTIEIADPDDGGEALRAAATRVRDYDWVCFTSPNAVERFLACLSDARAFGDVRVAAVGPGTAAALATAGIVADLVPERSLAEGLVATFPHGSGRERVLLPQAAAARPVLADGLTAKGWTVDVAHAYRTVPTTPSADLLASAAKADAIAFTSASTVTSYLAAAGPGAVPPVVACIGPVTAAAAEAEGLPVTVTATDHTLDGLVAALVAILARSHRPRSPVGRARRPSAHPPPAPATPLGVPAPASSQLRSGAARVAGCQRPSDTRQARTQSDEVVAPTLANNAHDDEVVPAPQSHDARSAPRRGDVARRPMTRRGRARTGRRRRST